MDQAKGGRQELGIASELQQGGGDPTPRAATAVAISASQGMAQQEVSQEPELVPGHLPTPGLVSPTLGSHGPVSLG